MFLIHFSSFYIILSFFLVIPSHYEKSQRKSKNMSARWKDFLLNCFTVQFAPTYI